MERSLGHCRTCARPFSDRASWRARQRSAEVRYCSAGCRRHKPTAADRLLEQRVLDTLKALNTPTSIAHLEVRLEVDGEPTRRRLERAVRRLGVGGALIMTRDGRVIDPGNARRPYLLSLTR